jgi:glycosyltransferase involved in cell wall biosynthesis
VEDPGLYSEEPRGSGKDYIVFAGRLCREKGIDLVLEAVRGTGLPLKVVGSGPMEERVQGVPNVEWLGHQPPQEVMRIMAGARFLIMASRGYETFGLVCAEAMACGTPCLVPDLGGLVDTVGCGGRGFNADHPEALKEGVRAFWEEAPRMRELARRQYLENFTPERTLAILREEYKLDAGK